MKFQLIFLSSIPSLYSLTIDVKLPSAQIQSQSGPQPLALGLVDTNTRKSIENTGSNLTDAVDELLGLDLTKLKLLNSGNDRQQMKHGALKSDIPTQQKEIELVTALLDLLGEPKH